MVTMGSKDTPTWREAASHTLHAALALKNVIEDRLGEEEGLLLADNEAMLHLAHRAEPPRMSDIADQLILTRGGTTKVVDRLEERGYVRRLPDPDDRRATIVEITEEGRAALTRARAVIDSALTDHWATHVDEDEAAVVLAVMRKVNEALHHQ